ncbi:MAG: penicillin-binding protein 2 [Candidatus Omnitrophica bacterium]|nr:penicillin-binding protein 2 [Candidatus Omnitrophota bacterium]
MRYFNHFAKRSLFILAGYCFLSCVVLSRLVALQLLPSPRLKAHAKSQHGVDIPLSPSRGNVYDRTLNILSTSIEVFSAYACPRDIAPGEREGLVLKLAGMLDLDTDWLRGRLERDKEFVWLKRKLDRREEAQLRSFQHPAIGLTPEWQRVYPAETLGAHLLGGVDIDNQGIEGVELFYNSHLSGRPGLRMTQRDARGRSLRARDELFIPSQDGHHVVLTIDQVIQDVVERELVRAVEASHAIAGTAIVLDPKDGSVLACANAPTFDANRASLVAADKRRNRAVTDMFEPGSVFKIVTASAALESGSFSLEEKVFCENGAYRMAGHTLHDYRPHGWLTFPEVFIKSSNIGTSKVAQRVGSERLWQAIQRFGFGRPTGIDFPGEAAGSITSPEKWSGTSLLAIPMGHEVSATALQMTCAMAAVANDGVMMKPRLVERIMTADGRTLETFAPQAQGVVMNPESARLLKGILTRVVEEGTGQRARVKGLEVAGKTGTAQKILEGTRGYSDEDFVAVFVGFAPVSSPQMVICVILDEPKPEHFGGTVCAPVFKRILEQGLAYLSLTGHQPVRLVKSF